MIQHRHHQAVSLLKKAADLDSSEACLNLAILYTQGLDEGHPEEKIHPDSELAARFAIQGLSLEHAKASPFPPQSSPHPAGPEGPPHHSTSHPSNSHHANGSANGTQKVFSAQPDQDNTLLNLEVTAHLANALTGLFRRGSITQDMSLRASSKGKSKDLWDSGTKVAYLLLDHPAVMRSPLQASAAAAAAADELWLPSSTAHTSAASSSSRRSSSRPGVQPFTLTSNQQLRRSIYVSLCYLLALVAYDLAVRHKTADFSDALMWWRRCINIEKQPGGSGTKDAEALIAKARFRVDMIEKAQRRDAQSRKSVHLQSISTSTPPLARASSSQVVLKHSPDKSLSLGAALDRSCSGDKHHPQMYMPNLNRRHTAAPAAHVNGVLASSTSAVPSSLPLHQPQLNRLPTSVLASKPYSSPTQSPKQEGPGFETRHASTSAGMPPSPSQKLRALHIKPFRSKAKSSLRFLAPHAAASRCGPTSATCYLSDEMVGVPASSLRHRASSASLFSDAMADMDESVGPSTGRKRTMSSASVASLPHFSATAPFEARSRPRAPSVLSPFGRSVNRNSVISNASDDSAAAPAQDQQQHSQASEQPKPSEATGALMAVLRSDILAEQDYDDWMAEQEAENYTSDPEDEEDGEDGQEVEVRPTQSTSESDGAKPKSPSFHVTSPSTEALPDPPLQQKQEEAAARQSNGRRKPRVSRLTTTTVDPVLDALEKASKFSRVSRCVVCGVKGINFRKVSLGTRVSVVVLADLGSAFVQRHALNANRCTAVATAE